MIDEKGDTIKIVIHGRGGQGAVTAAELIAEAAYLSGNFMDVHAYPSFGAERRGAPVQSYAKLSRKEKIWDRTQILDPDIIIVLDDTVLNQTVASSLKKDGIFILTTPNRTYRLRPGQKPLNKFHKREYYPHELENVLRNKFPDVKVWGVRGNEEVQKIEIERLKLGLIVSLVPSNLRKLMLKPVKSTIKKILKKIIRRNQKGKNDRDFLNRYSLKDFYVIENNTSDSLDL